jgi:phage-related protein
MPNWKIVFYPEPGENYSPFDYIYQIDDPDEKAEIIHRLEFMRNHEMAEWPHTWTKQIWGKVFELKTKNYRIMYFLEAKNIVLLHACRKGKQKTDKLDSNRAIEHYQNYLANKD